MNRAILFLLSILVTVMAYSQKVHKVSATYSYYAPETMSVEEAKRTALERAKIQAIADKFGTTVTQSTSTIISNKNGESDTQFLFVGGSEVKGEWIETIGEPSFEIKFENHYLIVICSVKGKAKEIESPKIEFIAKPLRNGTSLKFESTEFKDGDDFYMYFQSPVDGNLAIYLHDEMGQKVYSILPYKTQSISAYPIIANKEYILFSRKDTDKQERSSVDEYILNSNEDKEFNNLYIIFSPSQFGKRNGFKSEIDEIPDNITYKDFKQWLSKVMSKDNEIQVNQIHITISK